MSAFDNVRKHHSLKAMSASHVNNTDELVPMTRSQGLLEYCIAPTSNTVTTTCGPHEDNASIGRYLWALTVSDIPHAVEACAFGEKLISGEIKHSNLTGGSDAFAGGELWFRDDQTIIINFKSGRYGLNGLNAEEKKLAEDIINAFVLDNYAIAFTGWDLESGYCHTHLVTDPCFLKLET